MLWLVKIGQVSSCRKFMQHLESCLLWQLKRTEFCVNLWFFNRSFHWMYKMKFSCYSWLVCLLGFWLRNTSLVKAGNPISDGMVFVLRLAWCVHVRRGLKVWSDTAGLTWYLSGAASRMVSLSNYCIDVCFFNSNLMKSSVVFYVAI